MLVTGPADVEVSVFDGIGIETVHYAGKYYAVLGLLRGLDLGALREIQDKHLPYLIAVREKWQAAQERDGE